jgi:hypothetical protein
MFAITYADFRKQAPGLFLGKEKAKPDRLG